MGLLAFRTAVKPPVITSITATSTVRLDPIWTLPAGFTVVLTELEFSLNGSTGWTQIYSGAALTFGHTGRSAFTTYYYRARVKDSQGNYSAYSAVASQTTPNIIFRKWNPGPYVQTNGLGQDQTSRFGQMDTILNGHPNVKGIGIKIRGGDIWTGDGQYDFSRITADLNRLATAYGTVKRYHLRIYVKAFAGGTVTNPTPGQYIPEYILNNSIYRATGDSHTGFAPTNSGYMLNWWWTPTLNELIQLYQDMGDEFDDVENFENIVIMDETAPSFASSPPPSWSNAAGLAALIRMMEEIKPHWPKTNVIMPYNITGFSAAQQAQLLEAIFDLKCGIGGPDTRINSGGGIVEAQRAMMGLTSGVPAYLNKFPVAYNCENAPTFANETIAEVQNHCFNGIRSTHVVWQYFPTSTTGSWALLAPELDAGNLPTRTGCPENYGGQCSVG